MAPGCRVVRGYLVLSGLSRFAVEYLRVNTPVVAGLTQPQLWSVLSVAAGAVIVLLSRRSNPPRPIESSDDSDDAAPAVVR